MNRISFIKRLLATLFGAAIVKPGHSMPEALEPTQGSSRPKGVTGENSHPDPSSASGSASKTSQAEPIYLLSATVAGTHYYDFPTVGPQLLDPQTSHLEPIEHPATLVLEPDNEFDFRAIEVWWKDHKMGYIPKRDNKVLYNLMKDGNTLQALVRLQYNHQPEDIINIADFSYAYELRIRVYLPVNPAMAGAQPA
ncbi:MAG: HIRAN domain-containing protein [Flavobacteriales bacterium]|nr:HIRAN domain-containing protein [Flavobacteriales bacterium]